LSFDYIACISSVEPSYQYCVRKL